jgi:hypothetical protein
MVDAGSFVTLGTVAFTIDSPTNDGLADLWFDTESAGHGFAVDGVTTPMSEITINGPLPDLTVMPEPISSTLFAIGGATLGEEVQILCSLRQGVQGRHPESCLSNCQS